MRGTTVSLLIIAAALLVGGGVYYMQVYGYYERLPAVSIAMTTQDGSVQEIPVAQAEGIDAISSPIRFTNQPIWRSIVRCDEPDSESSSMVMCVSLVCITASDGSPHNMDPTELSPAASESTSISSAVRLTTSATIGSGSSLML